MKQLLIDALACITQDVTRSAIRQTTNKLRAAIAEPEHEPVATLSRWLSGPDLGAPERVIYSVKVLDAGKALPMGEFDLYTKPQPVAERYPLPDSLYPGSKDWVKGDYAERVEWLHSMYENQKEHTKMYVQMSQPAADMTDDEIFRVIGKMPKSAYTLVDFAHAVLAAQRGKV